MAEPDNLVLEHLRGIRAKLDEVDRKIDRVEANFERRFEGLDERIEGLETRLDGLTHAVMAGFGAIVKGRLGRLEAERI